MSKKFDILAHDAACDAYSERIYGRDRPSERAMLEMCRSINHSIKFSSPQ
jgi:hypothetical protein